MTSLKQNEKNEIEIRFDSKPADFILSILRTNNWKYSIQEKCWRTPYSTANHELATRILTLSNLTPGRTLYCSDGSTVSLSNCTAEGLTVIYKNNEYYRGFELLGKTLFLSPPHQSANSFINAVYDTYGYDKYGVDRNGYDRSGYNKNGFDKDGYNKEGYNKSGYNRDGFNRHGYNKDGFNKEGYNNKGFNKDGFNKKGYDKDGYNKEGFDRNGYNRNGYDKNGFGKDGYNKLGFDSSGYDRNGYNEAGFNCSGFDKAGYNVSGFDKNGFNRNGYDKNGFGRDGYNIKGYDKNGLNKDGYNNEGYDKNGFGKDGYNKQGVNIKKEFRNDAPMAESLTLKQTILYHRQHGNGLFFDVHFNINSTVLCVKFQKSVKEFNYPECFENDVLHLNGPNTDIKIKTTATPQARTELHQLALNEEKKHLSVLNSHIIPDIKNNESDYEDITLEIKYTNSDERTNDWNHNIQTKRSNTQKKEVLLKAIHNDPYFARVDNNGSPMYIGKHAYMDIVDWNDKRASIYYDYNILIGNKNHNITLVRDINIKNNVLLDIHDKYNSRLHSVDKITEISDPYLIKIIQANREAKNIHDIIATIQKNQYKIITEPYTNETTVCGCAGSGKTMILLHRLSYLMRNNKALSAEFIYSLSPTTALSTENLQLTETLNIEKINVFSNVDMYSHLLKELSRKNKLSYSSMSNNYHSNNEIAPDTLKKLYSQSTFSDIYKNILSRLTDDEKRNQILTLLYKRIEQSKIELIGAGHDSKSKEKTFTTLANAHEEYRSGKDQARNISFANVHAMLTRLEIDHTSGKITNSYPAYKTILNILLTHRELLSGSTLINKKTVAPEDDYEKLNHLRKFWDIASQVFEDQDPIPIFEKYSAISKFKKQVDKFANGNNLACILEIAEYEIADYKQNINISPYICYEWDLFAQLYAISNFTANYLDDAKLIFIDEFQDYSIIELQTLKRLLPNATFNYFGDFRQSIISKGVDEETFQEFEKKYNIKRHFINENYRNAKDITEFVNQRFEINMTPIGIGGYAQIISEDMISDIKIKADDRVAVICAPTILNQVYSHITNALNRKCQILSCNDTNIHRGIFNLTDVAFVKGLEFEKVIVYTDEMSNNEQYVAATRALNELYIIDNKQLSSIVST